MKPSLLTILIVTTLAMPIMMAQTPLPPTTLEFTDAEGDTSTPASTLAPHIDFLTATFTAENDLQYDLQMAGDQIIDAGTVPFSLIYTNFEYRTEEFQLRYKFTETNQIEAELIQGSNEIERIGRTTFESSLQMQNGLIQITLPWAAFEGTNGQTPIIGDHIQISSIESSWAFSGATEPGEQVIPPGGQDSIEIEPETKLFLAEIQPSLTISSPQPTISANGEETTYAWTLDIRNYEDKERVITITGTSPDDTELFHPATAILEPNGNATIRAYAVTPFGHSHGGTRDFEITASDPDASANTILQILYVTPPQPAGHHDTVFVHGVQTESLTDIDPTWLSTEEPDSAGAGAGAEYVICNEFKQFAFGWHIPLDPALSIGIDGIMGEYAEFTGTISQNIPLPDATLLARLLLTNDGDVTAPFYELDEWVYQEPWTGQANQETLVSLQISMPPELDYAPFSPGNNLQLSIGICLNAPEDPTTIFAGVISEVPESLIANLAQGSTLTLPLQDFLPENPPLVGDVQLTTGAPVQAASPGSVVSWDINVRGESESLDFSIVAPANFNARIQVDAETGLLKADMVVPLSAQNGDVLSVIVVGQDESSAAELRLGVRVNDELPVLKRAEVSNETPFPGIASILLIALVAAINRNSHKLQ